MREIEVLVRVLEPKDSVLAKLQKLNLIGSKKFTDIYFYQKGNNRFKPHKGIIDECLRVRDKEGQASITYKKDRIDKNGKWLYSDEEETNVSNFEEAKKILKGLGYAELARLNIQKHIFKSGEYEVLLEDAGDVGLFMEVELMDSGRADPIRVKTAMMEFLKELGIKTSDELNEGKLELALKQDGHWPTD